MPSEGRNPRNPSTPQSIPLQDLSRPPDGASGEGTWASGLGENRGRSGRSLLGNRQTFSARVKTQGRYERVLAGASSEADDGRLDVPHITTPRNTHQPLGFYDDGELSPVNIGDFQAAMGSVGLNLDAPTPPQPTAATPPIRQNLNPITEEAVSPFSSFSVPNEQEDYFSSPPDDRSPLTDSRFLQPISGSQLPTAEGQRHDRDHRHSPSYSRGMLGDDLPGLEGGLRAGARRSLNRMSSLSMPSLSRSLSSSASPLSSAGSMLRKMSQRVVNLSNEPEIVEQSIRRQATLDAPPSFPAMTEYAHDEPLARPGPLEKAPPLTHAGMPRHKWQQQTNPLRGNSLHIFSPDNRLRLWLCELLVHPITEPIILLLIIVQTGLLAAEAGPSVGYGERVSTWSTPIQLAMLVLFIIYTMELSARIIVSGLIQNAEEYSPSRSGVPYWRSILDQVNSYFALQREPVHVGGQAMMAPDAQVSILRTFTSIQEQPRQLGHGRQAQRIRLARRAFLRHSFNRVDLLAIVSFWISFVLNLTQTGTDKHIYTFQMLSCLRIVRLLSLTGGTSVSLSLEVMSSSVADI